MEWIRNNIGFFGGDSKRITMAGQSAGAGMVDYYAYGYAADPIANGFILQSGVSEGTSAPMNTTLARTSWLGMAGRVGCPNETVSQETFDCMVKKPAKDLIAKLGNGLTFVPVADDGLVFKDYKNRQSAKGGYIVGNTANEAGLLFLRNQNVDPSAWPAWNDETFTCPTAERVRRAQVGGNPTWRYRYYGDFPNMVLTTKPPSGAYHTADVGGLLSSSSILDSC
jgi:carboxylesterase type B